MKTMNIYNRPAEFISASVTRQTCHAELVSASVTRVLHIIKSSLLSVLLLSVCSCTNIYEGALKNSSNTSQTGIIITPNDISINCRSIDPNMKDTLAKLRDITLYGKKTNNTDGTTFNGTNRQLPRSGSIASLAALYNKQILLEDGPGTYTFELKGTIDSIYFYQKLENVEIEESRTNTISFELQPVKSSSDVTTSFDEYGGMHIKLYYSNSENATYTVKLTVEDLTTGEAIETDKVLSPQQTSGVYSAINRYVEYKRWASYGTSSSTPQIATGEYRVTFKFYFGEQLLNSLPYIVHVARGINTVYEDTIDLNEVYKITYNVNQGSQSSGLLEGEVKTEYYTRKSGDIVLYRPYRANYIFDGWYDENNNLITTIPHGSTGNKTVNAHWIDMHGFPSINKVTGSGTTWLVDLYVNPDAPYHYGNCEEYGLESITRAIEIIKHTGGTSPAFNIKIKGNVTVATTLGTDINSYVEYLALEGLSDAINGIPQDSLTGGFDSENNGTVITVSTNRPVTIKNLKITGGNTSNTTTGKGGGLYIGSNTTVTLDDDVLITGNSASEGAGIYNEGNLKIKGSAIVQATDAYPNDIYLAEGRKITVTGELTNPAEKVALITPAAYTQDAIILKTTGEISVSDIVERFSLTQKSGEHWEISSTGTLSEGYSTTSSDLGELLSQLNPNTASTPIVINITDNTSDFTAVNESVNSVLDTAGKYVKLSYKNAGFTDMAGTLSNYVTSLTIPASVTNVGFIEAGGNFSSFTVAGGNTTYTAENGILYANNGNKIVRYPPATPETTVTIPQNITAIADGAFAGCMNVEKFAVASGNTSFKVQSSDWVRSKEGLVAYQELTHFEKDSSLGDEPDDVMSNEHRTWAIQYGYQYGHTSYAPLPVLTSYDGTTLIACPPGLKLVTAAEIEEIYPGGDHQYDQSCYIANNPEFTFTTVQPYAFSNCNILTSLSLEISALNLDNKVEITAFTFYNCTSLNWVKFTHDKSTTIKTNAFAGCTSLSSLWFYAGVNSASAENGAYPSTCNVTISGQTN